MRRPLAVIQRSSARDRSGCQRVPVRVSMRARHRFARADEVRPEIGPGVGTREAGATTHRVETHELGFKVAALFKAAPCLGRILWWVRPVEPKSSAGDKPAQQLLAQQFRCNSE